MSKPTITIKVFTDSPEKLKKVQRLESYKRDKSMTVPEIVDMLADGYIKLSAEETSSVTRTEKD